MNPSACCCICLLMMVLILQAKRRKKTAAVRHVKRKRMERKIMLEMLERFVGKECVVYVIEGQLTGTVRELRDGWIILENSKGTEAVNAEYVTRIKEYPKNKKGKKTLVID